MSGDRDDRLARTPSTAESASLRSSSFPSTGAIAVSVVISAAALAGVTIHLADPKLKVDSVVVALLVIAIIPWLGIIFRSVEIPGIFKGEFQDLQNRVQKNSEELGRASAQIAKVERGVDNAIEDPGETLKIARDTIPASSMTVAVLPSQRPNRVLETLINEYNDIRATQPAGLQRTLAMTSIIRQMIDVAPHLQGFDWQRALESSDKGDRLAAYAFLYARPRKDAVDSLANSAIYVEDTPFGQYWGLLALDKATDQLDCDTARRLESALRSLLSSLRPGTDRYGLLQILIPKVEEIISRLCPEP